MFEDLSPLSRSARQAAMEVAEELGVKFDRAVVLRDRSNLLVHLRPAPVVARVATATGAVRRGDAWLTRELAVAGFLACVGAPVVAPSLEVAPGPHHRSGLALTFWEYVEELDAPLDAASAGCRLRQCHEALRDFTGELPYLTALEEAELLVPHLLTAGAASQSDAAILIGVASAVRERVERLSLPAHPLHGDAHLGNVINTARGPLWNDWEDTFLGPVAWDLACLHASAPPFGRQDPQLIAEAHNAYGNGVDTEALEAFIDARQFQVALWGVVIGTARADSQRVRERLAWLHHRGWLSRQ